MVHGGNAELRKHGRDNVSIGVPILKGHAFVFAPYLDVRNNSPAEQLRGQRRNLSLASTPPIRGQACPPLAAIRCDEKGKGKQSPNRRGHCSRQPGQPSCSESQTCSCEAGTHYGRTANDVQLCGAQDGSATTRQLARPQRHVWRVRTVHTDQSKAEHRALWAGARKMPA
jgi:hypothetical protein